MGLIIYFTIVILFGIIYYLRLGKPKIIEDSVNYDLCLKVNIIAYKTIDTAMKLYGIKNDIDEFLIFTLKEIKIRIDNSELPQHEKDYWTHKKIEYIYTKAIITTLSNSK